MYEGKIIKFYREKKKLTQEQLGKDICSTTHISKIECAQTTYATEITNLLCERLQINMEEELTKLANIKQKLLYWQETIIMQLYNEMDQINSELEHEELLEISKYVYMYQLLRARYLLMYHKSNEAFKILKKIQRKLNRLSPYETNLLKHSLGIYYLEKQDYISAIQSFKSIQITVYNNPEYYYHLAVAYHTTQSPMLAYYYAEKSHQYFKNINNYLRVIDAEMLMLIQVKDDCCKDEEIIKRFKNLIKSCELCNALDRKARVLHNLAFEYLRRSNYELASIYYKESMALKEKESISYLLSLEGYIRSSLEGGLLPKNELIIFAEKGFAIAKNMDSLLYIHLFKLLIYLLKCKEKEYLQYLVDKALPMFNKNGFYYLIERSNKELFNYYSTMRLTDQAMEIAKLLIKN
jgi:HTH-type transcriptional regulator, quorum sensing regulator NprR